MSTVYADTLEPSVPTKNTTLGATGDSITIGGDSINTNVIQDSGGNVLFQSDGSGTLSNVNSAFSADLKLLSTETASGASSLSFTSGIDSTYDVYIFKFIDYNPATDNTHLTFQCSTDGGSNYNTTLTTTVFYARHYESDASVLQYDSGDDQSQGTSYQKVTLGVGNESDASGSGEIYLFAPSSTTYVKHFYATSNLLYALDASTNYFTAGYFNTTSAINAISFKPVTGNFDGTIKMYGL